MGDIADISVARNALREKRKALFRTYLWAEFPAQYVTGLTEKGAPIFASAEVSAHVIDYFAAYGTTVSLEEAAEVLTGAWTYLSMHPGRYWAAYTINSPHTYRALTKDFLPDEHAYIAAIAAGDRPAAARVFPKTRWAGELQRKMAVSRASLHKETHR